MLYLRVWRNWQTRQTQDLVPRSAGSIPVTRTISFVIWSHGVVVNMPVCHTGDRGFKSRRDRHFYYVPIAQLDRASGYGPEGYGFESCLACHLIGKQLSLVERLVWDQDVAGSNPVFPTICGYSSTAERQPSKLNMRVRFSLPAPFFEIYRSSEKRIYFLFSQGILANYGQNILFFYSFMKHLDLMTIGD